MYSDNIKLIVFIIDSPKYLMISRPFNRSNLEPEVLASYHPVILYHTSFNKLLFGIRVDNLESILKDYLGGKLLKLFKIKSKLFDLRKSYRSTQGSKSCCLQPCTSLSFEIEKVNIQSQDEFRSL
jgi:hypothetical protein